MTADQYISLPKETRFALYQGFLLTLNIPNQEEFLIHNQQCENCRKILVEEFRQFIETAIIIKRSDLERAAKASLN